MILSTVALSSHQVHGFASHGLHRRSFVGSIPYVLPRNFVPRTKSVTMRDIVSILNDTFFLSKESDSFYDPRFLDTVFDGSESDPFMATADVLSAHGSFIANTWLSEMASASSHPLDFNLPQDVDSILDDILAPPAVFDCLDNSRIRLKTPLSQLSDAVVSELLIRPTRLAHIKTTASANHLVDMHHFLRATKDKTKPHAADELDKDKVFPILLDTGCSVSCSGFADDFHGELAYGDFGTVKTADGAAKIEGFGMLRWDVIDLMGRRVTIHVPGYYSPSVQLRLLSPQDYCRYHKLPSDQPQYAGCSNWMTLNLKDPDDPSCMIGALIDPGSRLPLILGELGHHDVKKSRNAHAKEARCHCHVTSVFDVRNVNLSEAQKRLKLDHDRLGHLSMKGIQRLYQPDEADTPDFDGVSVSGKSCIIAKDPAQLRCTPPICEACQVAKARRRPTGATKVAPVPDVIDGIRAEDMNPGDCVSVDQYESAVRGRRAHTRGKEKSKLQFVGGTLFYDHASSFIRCFHQVSLSAPDTIASKRAWEREGVLCGRTTKKYRTDNGIFTSKAYEESLDEHQYTDRSGVGAHHQNGVAESNIGKVQRMARAMLLHVRLHWPDEFSPDLWPFALDYAVYIHNHFPVRGKAGAPAPIDVFCGTKVGCTKLRRLKVFGCPAFVLDPRLQDGKKIPKWEARARKGQFLGFSMDHAATVGLIRHLKTGYISPQFHVVFDEHFDTVATEMSIDLSETWIDLFLNSREIYLDGWDEDSDGPLPALDDSWLPDDEKPIPADKKIDRSNEAKDPSVSGTPDDSSVHVPESTAGDGATSPNPSRPDPIDASDQVPEAGQPPDDGDWIPVERRRSPMKSPLAPRARGEPQFFDVEEAPPRAEQAPRRIQFDDTTTSSESAGGSAQEPQRSTREQLYEEARTHRPATRSRSSAQQPAPVQPAQPSRTHTRRDRLYQEARTHRPRTRSQASVVCGYRSGKEILVLPVGSRSISHLPISTNADVIAFALADWEDVVKDPYFDYFDAMFKSQIDHETLQILDVEEAFHPFAFSAKIQSEDFPSYGDIIRMQGDERRRWMEAMDNEISELIERKAFEFVPCSDPMSKGKQIVKSLWAFRRKRRPDGSISRYKARLVVRGDLQKGQFTTSETFAPVVEWSTVRMLFSLGVMQNWKSASIDFKNAFTQGQLPEPIYLELPAGFAKANPELSDHVMKITTSLYGDRRAANIWYRKIRDALTSKEIGFKCSEFDPCLFLRHDCMICLYVDDAILHARDDAVLDSVLKQIAAAQFPFTRDADFASYLGVLIEHRDDGSKKLSQPGLTKQLLEMMGMTDCNPSRTPMSTPLFAHRDSQPHDDSFNYRSALGMLMYLGNNTRPECAFAINACAQYSINPKLPHAEAVRRICRYLKGTANEGVIVRPNDDAEVKLDCYVDADFAGNWTQLEANDSDSVRSRAGFIISIGGVPVLWKSKRIQEICLSTMESEYIALSMAMRLLIYLRGLLFEIDGTFKLGVGESISTISTVFEDNRAAQILATTDPPRMTPRSKSLAVKYHWFRSKLSKELVITAVESAKNTADIFTKPIPFEAFARHRKSICGW